MCRAVRQQARAALVALAVLVAGGGGCKQRPREEPEPVPPAERAGEIPAPQRRVGVKVPMPPGWTALVAPDGSFQFGPPGHAVLRVDLRPGQGSALPSPEELLQTLEKSFGGFERSVEQKEGGPDFSLVRVELTPRLPDGGPGSQYPALFGARRVGKDLFLCATLPDITADEVHLAAEACRGLELQPPR